MVDATLNTALRNHLGVDPNWLNLTTEDVIDPELPIVDAHHHAWDLPHNRYLFDDLVSDFQCGHNIVATVYVQCYSMYRADGPPEMKPVGETEFANGLAAQSASGNYGSTEICAGIVGTADIRLGAAVEPVLHAHLGAAGQRFKGVRPTTSWHESDQLKALATEPHILLQSSAREAIRCIAKLNLCLDLWVYFTQLDDAIDICRAFPNLKIVIDHVGGPLGIGPYGGRRDEVFQVWRQKIESVAQHPNAYMKLGGLGMRYAGFQFNQMPSPPSSDLLLEKWKPYLELCIEQFGPDRCMFESNFPIDKGMCSYRIIWNAFKKLTKNYTSSERNALFCQTAANVYRLEHILTHS